VRPSTRPLLLVAAAVVALAAAGLLLADSVGRVRVQLEAVRDALPVLQDAVADSDEADVRAALEQVQRGAAAARAETSSPLWDAAGLVPVLGRTPRAVHEIALVVDELADGPLPRLTATARDLAPQRLRTAPDTIALDGLWSAGGALTVASAEVQRARESLAQVELRAVARPVLDAHDELATRLADLADLLDSGVTATDLLPSALGADGPRRYFVAFQTNAEARGTGGLVGAYGILEADAGRLRLVRLGDDGDLVQLPPPRVSFGPEFEALHGPHHRIWQNTNTTAHFPYAAQLWLDMWEQGTGERLDGALAVDLVGMADLLAASGSVELADGEQVTAENAVALTGRDAYARFDDDNEARKRFLVDVAGAVAEHVLTDGAGDPGHLLRALRGAAAERRLLAWSAHPDEQAALERAALGGTVPDAPEPFVAVVVNNAAGNKLDYYLEREVTYELGPCTGGRRSSSVVARLYNDVPDGELPNYVTGRLDLPGEPEGDGSTLLGVAVYTAQGAQLVGATLDGQPVPVAFRAERGHPVLVLPVELQRQQVRELVVQLDEPVVASDPVVLKQQLVRPQTTTVRDEPCSSS